MNMKYGAFIPMVIFSFALQGQTGTVASGTAHAKQPMPAASVSAEFIKRIDTKNAKQGDEVDARMTSPAKLPDGTELARGTKLIGRVTDVKAKSKEDKNAHLGFSIDHAVLKDGKQVPVTAIVTSVTGPMQDTASEMMAPGGGSSAPGGGKGSMGSAAPATSAAPVMSDAGQSSAGGVLKSAQDRVPVGNMPGVMLSAAAGSGSLDATGENISLDSGTNLTLSVAGGLPARQ